MEDTYGMWICREAKTLALGGAKACLLCEGCVNIGSSREGVGCPKGIELVQHTSQAMVRTSMRGCELRKVRMSMSGQRR